MNNLLWVIVMLTLLQICGLQAANVIFVTENIDNDGNGVPDDQSVIDFLRNETDYEYDVRRDHWSDLEALGTNDTIAYLGELNAADLIIFSRATTDGRYDNGNETTLWNSVTTPILCMNPALPRSLHWKWAIDTGWEATLDTSMMVMDASHPVFDGVTISPATGSFLALDPTVGSGRTSFLRPLFGRPLDIGNGTLIAATSEGRGWIAEWQANVETYPGSGQIPAGRRMLFCAGVSDWDPGTPLGSLNLTPLGQRAFLNAIDYLIASGMPKPVIGNITRAPEGAMRVTFSAPTNLTWNVYATSDLSNLSGSVLLGTGEETSPGHFQFTDTNANQFPQRFYFISNQ